jgi:endo-1,4-beta-xylanase
MPLILFPNVALDATLLEVRTMKRLRFNLSVLVGIAAALGFVPPASAQTGGPTLKEAYKDQFHIGAAINRTIALSEAVPADNVRRNLEQVKKDSALVIEQFNQVSPENDLKWQLVHPQAGPDGYDWAPADAFVDYGVKHNMYIVGHTLVWHGQTPRWVFQGDAPAEDGDQAAQTQAQQPQASGAGPGGGDQPGERRRRGRFGGGGRFGFTGPRATRDQLLERMRDHIHAVVGRYKGKIHAWDVVNEALADGGQEVLRDSLWRQIIGDDFIAKAFEYAHEADPDAILRYNDYGLENPAKRAKLIKLITQLKEQGVPVMAIGTQTHVSASSPSYEEMDRALTEMASLGLPIHVTELDVNTAERGQRRNDADIAANAEATAGGQISAADQRQAEQYANLFRAFLKHKDSVKVVTFWGANDAVSWRANGKPLLFDGEDKPKPAFDAVIQVAEDAK